eukprot:Phypoly_transcript_13925.p2 GENE.Phypoly_transcript_13925~~Phypoly_transcript_13925.p2  ORF type:complete len:144 (-),score=34.25 Phypoly_transcript_13925:596-985(-)
MDSIKKIREAAHAGNEANLAEATKQLTDSSSYILQKYTPKEIPNHKASEKEEMRKEEIHRLLERLRSATVSVRNAAKLVFSNPRNHGFVAQLDKESNEIAKMILILSEASDDEYLAFYFFFFFNVVLSY